MAMMKMLPLNKKMNKYIVGTYNMYLNRLILVEVDAHTRREAMVIAMGFETKDTNESIKDILDNCPTIEDVRRHFFHYDFDIDVVSEPIQINEKYK